MEDYKLEDCIQIQNKKYSLIENYSVILQLMNINHCLKNSSFVTLHIIFTYDANLKNVYEFQTFVKNKEIKEYINEIDVFVIKYSIKFEKKIREYQENPNIINHHEIDIEYPCEDSEIDYEKVYNNKKILDQLHSLK